MWLCGPSNWKELAYEFSWDPLFDWAGASHWDSEYSWDPLSDSEGASRLRLEPNSSLKILSSEFLICCLGKLCEGCFSHLGFQSISTSLKFWKLIFCLSCVKSLFRSVTFNYSIPVWSLVDLSTGVLNACWASWCTRRCCWFVKRSSGKMIFVFCLLSIWIQLGSLFGSGLDFYT